MFWIPEVFDSVFYNTHMTIPLQDISVRRKHYIKFGCTTIGLDFRFLSKTTANHVLSVLAPNLCATNLTDSSNSFRFQRTLGIPSPWDFIEKLPPSSSYTSILVIVDHLSKQSLFIPTHETITSPQLAQLFVLHVFSKHGVPSHITSDHSTEFVSHLFQSLGTTLDMKLHFTSGYHPKGDRQTERTNQTLEQYLQVYCNYQQDNWSELLPLAEFAYNNTPSATTSITPFFANKGYHPNLTVHPEHDLASARARDFVTDLDELHQQLRQHIADAQRRYQTSADSRRLLALEFKIGSHVYVKAQYFPMT